MVAPIPLLAPVTSAVLPRKNGGSGEVSMMVSLGAQRPVKRG